MSKYESIVGVSGSLYAVRDMVRKLKKQLSKSPYKVYPFTEGTEELLSDAYVALSKYIKTIDQAIKRDDIEFIATCNEWNDTAVHIVITVGKKMSRKPSVELLRIKWELDIQVKRSQLIVGRRGMSRDEYLSKAKELHPDRGGDTEAMKVLNEEYRRTKEPKIIAELKSQYEELKAKEDAEYRVSIVNGFSTLLQELKLKEVQSESISI